MSRHSSSLPALRRFNPHVLDSIAQEHKSMSAAEATLQSSEKAVFAYFPYCNGANNSNIGKREHLVPIRRIFAGIA